ncbi:MAG: DUF1593 domain-containing protein, partial [Bacteroidota bacterium]
IMEKQFIVISLLLLIFSVDTSVHNNDSKPRIIVASNGEIDEKCSMVRFLLSANEWDIECIVTSSSQYHWQEHRWAGDDWIDPYLDTYAQSYPNLIKHNPDYTTPEYLHERSALGNVKAEGEMEGVTAGSQLIVNILLDETDNRPVWVQAWGRPNTMVRALKTIEIEHTDRMAEVAQRLELFLIWEQNSTYQTYIRPHWNKYNILTIVSDQFNAFPIAGNLNITRFHFSQVGISLEKRCNRSLLIGSKDS